MNHRRGRRAQHYTTSWGETIYGLCRRANGRFYPVGRNDIAFGQDEAMAVHRFRQWQAMQAEDPQPPPIPVELRLSATTLPLLLPEGDTTREADDSSTPTMAELGQALEGSSAISLGFTIDDIRVQERLRLRRLILNDPRQAALELDIPHLAHHPRVPDAPEFTLKQLGAFYLANKRNRRGELLDEKHKKNSQRWWDEFCEVVDVRHARDLTAELVRRYHDHVMQR
ncbi:MAG TPA: hypothetical protein PLQ87_09635, partial [Phycisphaerae bacterium]|nr:hypothetical protein [Phycisphaerae bacterium]